jgi:hypothetical protein
VPVFVKINVYFRNQWFGANMRPEVKWGGFGVFCRIKWVCFVVSIGYHEEMIAMGKNDPNVTKLPILRFGDQSSISVAYVPGLE